MTTPKKTLQCVQSFIRNDLPRKLARDLKRLRIIMEADLEAATYYHLRTFLKDDDAWRVFARKHARPTRHYIDLIIFKDKYPRLAVELKWNCGKISKKDRRSLNRAVDKLGVNKAYFIATCVKKAPYQKIKKTEIEKNRIFEVIITPDFPKPSTLQDWKAARRAFKTQTVDGKAIKTA